MTIIKHNSHLIKHECKYITINKYDKMSNSDTNWEFQCSMGGVGGFWLSHTNIYVIPLRLCGISICDPPSVPSEKDLIAPKPSKPTSLRRWIKRGPEMRKIITLNTDLLSGSSLQNSLISPFLSFDDGVLEPNHKIMKNFYWHFTTTFSIACKPRFARLNLSIKIALKTSGVQETKLRTLCSGRKCRWLEVAFWDARMTRGLSLWGKLS